MLRVRAVPGEPTRFWVESNSLVCVLPECSKLYSRHHYPRLRVGMSCPKCHAGTLDVRFHVVDITEFNGIGQCGCEFFTFSLAPQLAKLSPVERVTKRDLLRCSHIKAARDFALDLAVRLHDHQQKHDARGQRR